MMTWELFTIANEIVESELQILEASSTEEYFINKQTVASEHSDSSGNFSIEALKAALKKNTSWNLFI